MKNTAIFGIYPTRVTAEHAVDELIGEGFHNDDVSILFSSSSKSRHLTIVNSADADVGHTGALPGATIGGVLGLLVGIGSLAIPGVGLLIAAGPIMTMLAGAGVGGALGGLTGALIGLGIPEFEAKRYEERINDGEFLLSVTADTNLWIGKAIEVLKATGAQDISRMSTPAIDEPRESETYRALLV